MRLLLTIVAIVSVALHVIGLSAFLVWLSDTDIMWGKVKGSPWLILTALWASLGYIVLTCAWWALAGVARFSKPKDKRPSPENVILSILFLALPLLSSSLIVVVGNFEKVDAQARIRREQPVVLVHGMSGAVSSGTISELVDALRDDDSRVRRNAADALEQLGPDASEAAPALGDALQDRDEGVSVAAANALLAMGPLAEVAVPDLLDAVRIGSANMRMIDRDSATNALRVKACDALVAIGPSTEPALRELAEDGNPNVRLRANEALKALRSGP